MKNLTKLALAIIIVAATVVSCNKKQQEAEPVKIDNVKLQEELKKSEELKADLNLINEDVGLSLQYFVKNNILIFSSEDTEYIVVKSGQMIEYYRNGKTYSGKLTKEIIAMNSDGDLIIDGGYIVNSKFLELEHVGCKYYEFPKTLEAKYTLDFVNKYEGSYHPIDQENISKNLEEFYRDVNDLDEYGYRIDLVRICDKGFGIKSGKDTFMFDDYGNLKQDRETAQNNRGELYMGFDYILLPRSENK